MTEMMRSGRGFVLSHNNFVYRRNKTRRDWIYWRCTTDGCPTRMKTNIFDRNEDIIVDYIELDYGILHV